MDKPIPVLFINCSSDGSTAESLNDEIYERLKNVFTQIKCSQYLRPVDDDHPRLTTLSTDVFDLVIYQVCKDFPHYSKIYPHWFEEDILGNMGDNRDFKLVVIAHENIKDDELYHPIANRFTMYRLPFRYVKGVTSNSMWGGAPTTRLEYTPQDWSDFEQFLIYSPE
jgi:hypothetical protein